MECKKDRFMKKEIEYRTFEDMSICIRKNLYKIKEDIDLVVGIPRSGIIPAYMIALFKNVQACSIDEFISQTNISKGFTREVKTVSRIRNVLIVDDSIHSGRSFSDAKDRLYQYKLFDKYNIKFLAIYARKQSIDLVDYYFEIVPVPRMFEWNYLNININERSCFDMDGVLCIDPTPEENDDGKKYREFLLNAKPLYIPEYTIHSIVTSRLEKYRKETEIWLKKNNVRYKNLFMLDLPSKEERLRQNAHANFKAKIYLLNADTDLFVESNEKQAKEIACLSGKPCICVENNKLYKPDKTKNITLINLDDYGDIKTKKILLYSHEFTYTGAPHSLLRICRVILKSGYFVEVWGPENGDFKKEFEKLGIKVRIIPYSAFTVENVMEAVKSFDIALVNTAIPYLAYAAISRVIPTIWYIREATNLEDICYHTPGRENSLRRADELVSVSEYAAEYIVKNYNKKVRVVHNCVEDFGEAEERAVNTVNFVALGTISYRKGFDVCVAAFNKLSQSYQNMAHLYFAGRLDPKKEDYWKEILDNIKENPNISYVGEISDIDEKVKFLKGMDVVVVPSRDEACSLVVLEGASMSKPLIVTENVGAKYIVKQDNGFILKADDIDGLANIFQWFIDNKDKIGVMGKKSRQIYKKEATIELYEKNISHLISDYLKINLEKYRKSHNDKNVNKVSLFKKTFISLKNEGLCVTIQKIKIKLHLQNKQVLKKRSINAFGSDVLMKALAKCSLANIKNRVSNISILTTNCNPVKDVGFLSNKGGLQMVNIDLQKNVFETLFKDVSDYFVLDLLDERFSLGKIFLKSGQYVVTRSIALQKELKNIEDGVRIKSFKFSDDKAIQNIKFFCDKLKSKYKPQQIILIKNKFSSYYMSQSNKLKLYPDDTLQRVENNNKKLEFIFKYLNKELCGCKIIDMKKFCIPYQKKEEIPGTIEFGEPYFIHFNRKLNNILLSK